MRTALASAGLAPAQALHAVAEVTNELPGGLYQLSSFGAI
jgi:hypothetical protein